MDKREPKDEGDFGKKRQQSDVDVYEAAICFARMWGVMEALEPLPNLGFERVRNIVMTLAEEFCTGEEGDFIQFFAERAEVFKREVKEEYT